MTKPNILLFLPDQWRGDWLGFFGNLPVRTPNIDALARRGVVFSQTWTPSPICAPARACFATMENYDHCQVQHNHHDMDPASPTLYRSVQEAGYKVASVGKIDLLKGKMDWGADGLHINDGVSAFNQLGFTDGSDSAGKHDAIKGYEDGKAEPFLTFLEKEGLAGKHVDDFNRRSPANPPTSVIGSQKNIYPVPPAYAVTDLSPLPDHAYCDNWVGRQAMELIGQLTRSAEPWFLTVNFAGPHEPVDVTAKMREKWENIVFPDPKLWNGTDRELHQAIRQNYAAMQELIDDWLGVAVKTLNEHGVLDNTILIFASDHGDMLGDYNLWAKKFPFEPSVHVPLVFAGPKIQARSKYVDSATTLLDLAATIVDYSGAKRPGPAGSSLRPELENRETEPRRAVSGLGSWRAISDGKHKLVAGWKDDQIVSDIEHGIWNASEARTSMALFDAVSDPFNQKDLSKEKPEIAERLWADLLKEIKKPLDVQPEGRTS